jgi:anthranilate phosphoribosyltransferase
MSLLRSEERISLSLGNLIPVGCGYVALHLRGCSPQKRGGNFGSEIVPRTLEVHPMTNGLSVFLPKLVRGEHLTRPEARELFNALLSEESTDAQIAGTLVALAAKGETVDELAGMALELRARAVRVNCGHECYIDTAGTGSSRAKTFNISTAAAFVIAGAGLPVAKHGNRAASSKSGSADVLAVLGVNVGAIPTIAESALNEIGMCFMFAPLYHGATARVAGIRRQLGVHTIFNLLGPLSNPAGAPRQIIGVWRKELTELLAQTLAELGTERAWVVHGEDGLDEITLAGKTFVSEACEGRVSSFEITPEDFGLNVGPLDQLRGGDPEVNGRIIRDVLIGARRDEARSLVLMTSAAALMLGGIVDDLRSGVTAAAHSIDSGKALEKLELLIKATN